MPHPPTASTPTRERLLEAAGEVFGEEGYQGATVRKICQRADANVGAINYHFGDKHHLYREVLRYAFACLDESHPVTRDESLSAQGQVRGFVSTFLARLFSVGQTWHGRIMAREFADPTGALRDVVESHMRPTLGILDSIIAEVNDGLTPAQRRLHALSLLAQCVFFRHCRPVLDILFGPDAYARPDQIPALADHIVGVFLAGLGSDTEDR